MKKLFLIVAVAVFGMSNVNAQEMTFGVKAGVNLANFSGDNSDDFDMKTSFHVGGVVDIGISDKFSVQPELLYSAQGSKMSFEGFTVKYNLDYINIPVLAKFLIGDGFSVEAGPQVGFLVSAKAKSDGESMDLKDELKGTDFSGVVGLGYKMDSGLNFAARYNLGLGNIAESGEGDLKNNVIQLSVGYMF